MKRVNEDSVLEMGKYHCAGEKSYISLPASPTFYTTLDVVNDSFVLISAKRLKTGEVYFVCDFNGSSIFVAL